MVGSRPVASALHKAPTYAFVHNNVDVSQPLTSSISKPELERALQLHGRLCVSDCGTEATWSGGGARDTSGAAKGKQGNAAVAANTDSTTEEHPRTATIYDQPLSTDLTTSEHTGAATAAKPRTPIDALVKDRAAPRQTAAHAPCGYGALDYVFEGGAAAGDAGATRVDACRRSPHRVGERAADADATRADACCAIPWGIRLAG